MLITSQSPSDFGVGRSVFGVRRFSFPTSVLFPFLLALRPLSPCSMLLAPPLRGCAMSAWRDKLPG